MESASWLTSAGVIGPVIGGAGWKGRRAGCGLRRGAGEAAPAVSDFFWQAMEAPSEQSERQICQPANGDFFHGETRWK